MFRRRATPTAASEQPGDTMGFQRVIALEAVPDHANIIHNRALNHAIGLQLQGYAGEAIGYDRGDPGRSLTAVINPPNTPTAAMAQIGHLSDATATAPPPEITDIVMSDPALDPYQSLLWSRITR